MASSLLVNLLQVLTVVLLAPLYKGTIAWLEETLQGKIATSPLQPYYDLSKLYRKSRIVSTEASWIFRFAPYMSFVVPIVVTLLIPALTSFPLFFAFAGDMVGAGFILGLGGFFTALAAVDTANPYGPVGASRTRMVSLLVEPIFIIVFFTVSFVANSTIPYVVQKQWVASAAAFFAPSHVLLAAAFVMIVLAENGRLPVDNPGGHFELAMIDESKNLEYSGPALAMIKWAGQMKLMVLSLVFVNVLVTPWGLAATPTAGALATAIVLVSFKLLVFGTLIAVIETSLAKLRLFRISEFLGATFVTAVVAMVAAIFHM